MNMIAIISWALVIGLELLVGKCSATATFQVNVGDLLAKAGGQKRNSPLSAIIDYRFTDVEAVKNVHFRYYDR